MPEDAQYYSRLDAMYRSPGHLMARKAELVTQQIRGQGAFLDVGSGTGEFLHRLRDRFSLLAGVDVNLEAIAFAREKTRGLEHINVIPYDGHALPFGNETFDACMCLDVLEHCARPDHLLAEIHRVMKPGGSLIVTTPNWYDIIYGRLLGLSPHHVSVHGPWGWRRIVRNAGFAVPPLQGRTLPPAPLRISREEPASPGDVHHPRGLPALVLACGSRHTFPQEGTHNTTPAIPSA